MPAHCANAQRIAEFLPAIPRSSELSGLPTHPGTSRPANAFGAVISFEVQGGYDSGKKVMDRVQLFARAASLGDTRSLIVHSASTSHRAVPPAERHAMGITDGLVRLSVGVEAAEDLLRDLHQALV
jgi:methionine-gamma-lyase